MTLSESILALAAIVFGGGHVWTWWASRGKVKVDLIGLSQAISESTMKGMDRRIHDLEAKVEDMNEHIVRLEVFIRDLGHVPPPPPKRRAALKVVVNGGLDD